MFQRSTIQYSNVPEGFGETQAFDCGRRLIGCDADEVGSCSGLRDPPGRGPSHAMDLFKQEAPSVVTLDLGLPPYPLEVREGFAALNEMLSHDGFAKIVVITGQGEKDHALKAIGQGAYDFFCKPIQVDELKVVLQRAFYVSQLERKNRELQLQSNGEPFATMLGTSPEIQEVFASIRKVAATDVPVLVTGESGTGKELVAKALHQLSTRKTGPSSSSTVALSRGIAGE